MRFLVVFLRFCSVEAVFCGKGQVGNHGDFWGFLGAKTGKCHVKCHTDLGGADGGCGGVAEGADEDATAEPEDEADEEANKGGVARGDGGAGVDAEAGLVAGRTRAASETRERDGDEADGREEDEGKQRVPVVAPDEGERWAGEAQGRGGLRARRGARGRRRGRRRGRARNRREGMAAAGAHDRRADLGIRFKLRATRGADEVEFHFGKSPGNW